jgi:excinuclease ABC subunit A
VVDRVAVRPDLGNRLPDSIATALDLAEGLLVVEFADEKEKGEPKRLIMSSKFACPVSGFTIPEIEPRLFSFNNPHGACPECDGLGSKLYFDTSLSPDESLAPLCHSPWARSSSPYYLQTLEAITRHYKVGVNTPRSDLPKKVRDTILFGSGEEETPSHDGARRTTSRRPSKASSNMERRYKESDPA